MMFDILLIFDRIYCIVVDKFLFELRYLGEAKSTLVIS
jgi:hypothetical protein